MGHDETQVVLVILHPAPGCDQPPAHVVLSLVRGRYTVRYPGVGGASEEGRIFAANLQCRQQLLHPPGQGQPCIYGPLVHLKGVRVVHMSRATPNRHTFIHLS
jgi:hypothetical protein